MWDSRIAVNRNEKRCVQIVDPHRFNCIETLPMPQPLALFGGIYGSDTSNSQTHTTTIAHMQKKTATTMRDSNESTNRPAQQQQYKILFIAWHSSWKGQSKMRNISCMRVRSSMPTPKPNFRQCEGWIYYASPYDCAFHLACTVIVGGPLTIWGRKLIQIHHWMNDKHRRTNLATNRSFFLQWSRCEI